MKEKNKKFEIPNFRETFIPILKVLQKEETLSRNQIIEKVRNEHYGYLPVELRIKIYELTKTNILNYRIWFGISYLKMANFIERPEKAIYKITAKGLKTLEKGNLDWDTFKEDPEYKNYLKRKSKKKNNNYDEDLENSLIPETIEQEMRKKVLKTKKELLKKLKDMNPYLFEEKILELFTKMGYGEFLSTKKSRDSGIDGIVNSDKLGFEKIYVQIKKWDKNQIQEKDIRDFIGAMSRDTNKGIFITTSNFSKNSENKAKDATHKIKLINGEQLVDLMYKYNLGVEVKNTYDIKQIDESFFNEGR